MVSVRGAAARLASALLIAGVGAGLSAADVQAKSKPASRPSLRLTGISVNMQYELPGTRVTLKNPVNACYYIGGADQTPSSVTMVAYVHAVKIPASAPLTETVTAPWGSFSVPSKDYPPTTHFGSLWFNRGGVKSLFGGPTGRDDWFMHYSPFTGDEVFNGRYAVSMAVKVGGRTLRSSATLTIDCNQ